ncbi:MAG: OmpA family protein [Saprospiraceae bacterium]|nr:OmpA family protein [Saprospiraceae bacterium]
MQNKKYLVLLQICFVALQLTGQNARLKRANEAMQELDYMTAIVEYQQVLQKEDNTEAKLNLAECYRKINDTENAEYWYSQVVRLPNIKPVNKLYYGMMLQANGKCDQARVWLEQFLKEAPGDARAQYLAKACDQEEELLNKNRGIYTITHLPVNSNLDDFAPALLDDELVFASDRANGVAIKRTSMWTGNPFAELYKVKFTAENAGKGNLVFDEIQPFSNEINTRFHEASAAFGPDGVTIYFTRNHFNEGVTGWSEDGLVKLSVYAARLNERGEWSNVEILPFCSTEYSTVHPSVSADGKRIYYASNRPGGFGGMDLYFSDWNNGAWSAPINMGPVVNTEGNEIFPFSDPGGRLFFASNGHSGLGGLDVFYTVPLAGRAWSMPVNLGAPINSNRDDFGIVFGNDPSWGFFTSDRDGGAGRDDIYAFQKNAAPVEIVVMDALTNKPIPGATVLNVTTGFALTTNTDGVVAFDMKQAECAAFTMTKKGYETLEKTTCATETADGQITRVEFALQKLTNFTAQGIVFDMSDGFPAEGARVTLLNDCGKPVSEPFLTGPDGRFKFKLDRNCCYTLRASMEGFIAAVGEGICTKSNSQSPVFKVNLSLEPYRDAEGFIVDNQEEAAHQGPIYNDITGLYENPDGSPASFLLGNGLEVRDGVLFDNGSPSRPDETRWQRGSDGFLVNLYYDFNSAKLRPESFPELSKLFKTLKENPDLLVEIASHTDARGSDEYNLQLSQQRADAVVEWLAAKGIPKDRLSAKGYGETKLVNGCKNGVQCSEQEHQLNRRTEFRITGTGGVSTSKPPATKPKTAPCEGCPF